MNTGHYIFIGAIVQVLVIWGSIHMGYWMGRKTITDEPLIKREFDPGPKDGDDDNVYDEALKPLDEEERGISTL